jgi:hypothetical protein
VWLVVDFDCGFDYKLVCKHDSGIEGRLNMLLMSTLRWILLIGVAVVILVVFIGRKIKDRYF